MNWLVRSALCALYPRTDVLPGLEDCGIDDFLRRFRRETTLLIWLGVVASALAFHVSPILTIYVPLPAFALPRRLLDQHAFRLSTTSLYLLRQTSFVLKLPAGLCWGADPEVRKRLGFPPLPADPDGWRTS